jgi:hypothetical protein
VISCAYHGLVAWRPDGCDDLSLLEHPVVPGGGIACGYSAFATRDVVHVAYAAGVSRSTTTAIWEVQNFASLTIGKILAASKICRNRAIAGWQGVKALEELFGQDADGQPFGDMLLDGMAGGALLRPGRNRHGRPR